MQVEAWALEVVDRVRRGEPIEDTRVELKAALGEPEKLARRIAGHANASRGASILWLFGVDEESGVVGCAKAEFTEWWAKVSRQFDELPPEPLDLVVPTEDGPVVAVLFETDRAPFVVRNPLYGKGGSVELEVPWREGTATRTARRRDLIRLLAPITSSIDVVVFGGFLSYGQKVPSGEGEWHLSLDLYIDAPVGEVIVVPDHELVVDVAFDEWSMPMLDASLHGRHGRGVSAVLGSRYGPRQEAPEFIERGDGQAIITGPGKASLWAKGLLEPDEPTPLETCHATVSFTAMRASRETRFTARLVPVKPGKDETARWIVSDAPGGERRQDRRVVFDEEGDWSHAED